MTMQVLVPNEISTIVASSIAQPDPLKVMPNGDVGEVVWVTGTTYAVDDRVILTSTRRTYRDTVGGVSNRSPDVDPLRWFDEGPTNQWAWADAQAATSVISASPYTLTVEPGAISDIELYGLTNVDTVAIEMLETTAGPVVFSETFTTDEYASADPHWSFYFDGPEQGETISIPGLPVYPGCRVSITLTSYDGQPLQVGLIAFGSYESLGIGTFGFEAIYRDYGYTDTDRWGNTVRVPGAKAKDLRGTAFMNASEANGVASTVRRLLDRGAIYVPSPNPEHRFLKTWGLIKPARIQAAGPTHAIVDIEVEGLI